MKILITAICCLASGAACFPQSTFSVIGTPIPSSLAQQNYGSLPKGVVAYDLNICNRSAVKESVVSGEIYQALSGANGALKPIGRLVFACWRVDGRSLSLIRPIYELVANSRPKSRLVGASDHGVRSDL